MKQILNSYLRFSISKNSTSFLTRSISTGHSSFPFLCVGVGQSGSGHSTLVPKGKVFQKEPAKVHCERGKDYKWCSCGVSKKQPFCDGRPMCQPVSFKPRESKEYVFCNCKQTNKQPFCDGSHKNL